MRKESKEMAVTATTMKKEKRNETAATTFVNYLESWYQNEYLPNSTSSSTDAYYHWMIFNVIEPSLPDKERAVDDIDAEYLNALLACINQKNENTAASAYRFLRVFIKDRFEPDTGDYELFFQIKKYSVLEKDPVLYTPEQLTCLLSAAKKDNTSHYLEYALALYCGLKPGEILGLKYDSFDLEAGTVTICGLHARNYMSADRNGGNNSQNLKYSGRKLRSDSNYRTVPVPEFLFDEIRERKYLNEGILLKYPGLAEEGALCLGPYGKVKTLPTLNTRLKKITQSYGLPHISIGDLRYMYLADLIKKEKQFKKIMELFGYANPYRMLNLCQQIADIQGETLTVNVPFPEIFYYKM